MTHSHMPTSLTGKVIRRIARWAAFAVMAIFVGTMTIGVWLETHNSAPIPEHRAPIISQPNDIYFGRTLTPWEKWRSEDCTSMAAWKRDHDGYPPPYVLVKRPDQLEGAWRVPFDRAYALSSRGAVWQLAACPDDTSTHEKLLQRIRSAG